MITAAAYSTAAARPKAMPFASCAPGMAPSATPETNTMPMIAASAQRPFFTLSFSRKRTGESNITIVGCI